MGRVIIAGGVLMGRGVGMGRKLKWEGVGLYVVRVIGMGFLASMGETKSTKSLGFLLSGGFCFHFLTTVFLVGGNSCVSFEIDMKKLGVLGFGVMQSNAVRDAHLFNLGPVRLSPASRSRLCLRL